MKKLTAVLLIAIMLISICPHAFAATFTWVTQNPIVCDMVYEYTEFGVLVGSYDEKMGFISKEGNMIIPFERGYSSLCMVDYESGLLSFVDANNQAGVMDLAGNIIVPTGLYERIDARVDDYVYIAAKKVQEGYYECDFALVDVKGNIIIPYGQFEMIDPGTWYGTVLVRNEDYKYGVYSSAGQPIIPIEYGYDEIHGTGSPYRYLAEINGRTFLLDNNAQQLKEFTGYISNEYEIENYIVEDSYEEDIKTIYDLNGNVIGTMGAISDLEYDKYICDYDSYMLSDLSGNIIAAPGLYTDFRFINEKYVVVSNDNYEAALIDTTGNVIIPFGTALSSIYDVSDVIDDKYLFTYNQVMDIYGNVIAESGDGAMYYLGDGYVCAESFEGGYGLRFGKVSGEPVKPAAPVDTGIKVTVNGTPVQFADQAPVIVDGRTLLPLRAVFDLLGATIEWDGATQTVYAKRAGVDITLTIGASEIWVNGQPKALDVRAQIMNGRTMVPVRAVADAFGCGIGWDAATSTVIITTN